MREHPVSSKAHCFAQRMLSPYRGLMHSVVTRWADAVTTDGRTWTLYVRGECLYDDPTDLKEQAISVPDVKYGTWSEKTGFQRAPIRLPTFDGRVRQEGEALLAAVRRHAPELPFPLADRFEFWLLHAGSAGPLALLASACTAADCEPPPNVQWTPGRACMSELSEAAVLRDIIRQLAGEAPRAQWFERHPDGSGTPRTPAGGAETSADDQVPGDCFPPLFVDGNALAAEHAPLLEALHRWQSPALLQLQTLTDLQRARLEEAACGHAMRLAEQLPLYPCVLDEAAITAALVEARLRRSARQSGPRRARQPDISPDYIEIPDG